MPARAEARSLLEEGLGWRFKDAELLERALTHASVSEGKLGQREKDNERLEFLGDRVLGLLVAETLIAREPRAAEGELALKLNALVNRAACAEVGRRMGLAEALRLSPGEVRSGGRSQPTILADACEAVMAAIYLDGGLEAARDVFARFWGPVLDGLEGAALGAKDPKTALQERAQRAGRPAPVYRVLAREGPDHAPTFTVEAVVEGLPAAAGRGSSRQAAEKAAAEALLRRAGP